MKFLVIVLLAELGYLTLAKPMPQSSYLPSPDLYQPKPYPSQAPNQQAIDFSGIDALSKSATSGGKVAGTTLGGDIGQAIPIVGKTNGENLGRAGGSLASAVVGGLINGIIGLFRGTVVAINSQ